MPFNTLVTKLNLSKTLPSVMSFVTLICVAAPALATGPVLKGKASQTDTRDYAPAAAPSRTDYMNDPFDTSSSAAAPVDPGSFNNMQAAPPPQVNMAVQQPRSQPQEERPHPPPQLKKQANPKDVDETPQMQIAWNEWHSRVAGAIFQRYSMLSNFAFSHSRRTLTACVSYVVTRDGQIMNARLVEPSVNPLYNLLVVQVIKSLNGDLTVLQFPQGSRRQTMDKASTFIQDNEAGFNRFKTIEGDQETITH